MGDYYETEEVTGYWNARHLTWDQEMSPEARASLFTYKKNWFNERFEHILPLTQFPEGKVLDYGCGCGMYSVPLRQRFEKYYGVDTSAAALGIALRHFGLDSQNSFRLLPRQGAALPFPNGFFDCVVSITVLQHLPVDVRIATIQEIKRVLKPNGGYLGLEMIGDTAAFDMPAMSEEEWHSAWSPLKLVFDIPPKHPEWAADNVWYSEGAR